MKKLMAIALCAAMLVSMFCVNVFADTTGTNIAANATVSVSYVDTTNTETPITGGGLEKLNDGVVDGNNQSTYWEVEHGSIAVSFKFDKTYVIDRIYLVTENWYDHGATKPMHSQNLHFEAKVNGEWTPITEVFNDVDTAGVENIDVANNIVPVDIVLDDYAVTDEIRLVFDECTRAYFNAKEVMVYGVGDDDSDETTVPGGDETTTEPTDNDTTTVPGGDETTTEPADNDTTTVPDATTTEKPADNNTTNKPDEPAKKGCGGFAVAAQLIAVLGAAITVVVIKKK